MEGYVFQSTDKNEDEFKYVFLCPDTPATTYHIEFRYGSDLTELLKLNTGKYYKAGRLRYVKRVL